MNGDMFLKADTAFLICKPMKIFLMLTFVAHILISSVESFTTLFKILKK